MARIILEQTKKTTMRKKRKKVDAETAAVGRFQNDSPSSPLSVV
jgi:hypothetical protein